MLQQVHKQKVKKYLHFFCLKFNITHTFIKIFVYLFFSGQENFDPANHKFSEEDLKPQPIIKKSKKVSHRLLTELC